MAIDNQFQISGFNRYHSNEKAIYTGDNRQNLFEENISEKIKEQAKSVACLIELGTYFCESDEGFVLGERSLNSRLQETYRKTSTVNFGTEPSLGFGTAFLVSEKLALTAGHCVCKKGTNELNDTLIKNTRLVFGFQMSNPNEWEKSINKNRVYRFEVISHKNEVDKGDWALLKLSEEITFQPLPKPLEVDFIDSVGDSLKLYMLGHPYGLPIKLADEGETRNVNNTTGHRFQAQIVAYQGNSGSPVFNKITHKVVGILVAGNEDFCEKNQTMVDNVVDDTIIQMNGYEKCQRMSTLNNDIVRQIDPDKIPKRNEMDEQLTKLVASINETQSLTKEIKEGLIKLGQAILS